MPIAEKLGEYTFYVRGSPSTLVTVDPEDRRHGVIVDPGHGGKRRRQLSKTVREAGIEAYDVVLTHYHSDHLAIVPRLQPVMVYAPRNDAPMVEDPRLRILVTFGRLIPPGHPILPFDAPGVQVDRAFEPGDRVASLDTIPLPGHTLGQAGVYTPDGVLYLGDAAFGDRVLAGYGIPYHVDIDEALRTLYAIRDDYAPEASRIVFSHGPLLGKREMLGLLEENIRHHERVVNMILEEAAGRAPREVLVRVLSLLGVEATPQLVLLAGGTVENLIAKRMGLEVRDGDVRAPG